ncbi:hypothetical protein pb186bvf_018519 [Paramecium bursaria]
MAYDQLLQTPRIIFASQCDSNSIIRVNAIAQECNQHKPIWMLTDNLCRYKYVWHYSSHVQLLGTNLVLSSDNLLIKILIRLRIVFLELQRIKRNQSLKGYHYKYKPEENGNDVQILRKYNLLNFRLFILIQDHYILNSIRMSICCFFGCLAQSQADLIHSGNRSLQLIISNYNDQERKTQQIWKFNLVRVHYLLPPLAFLRKNYDSAPYSSWIQKCWNENK